MTDYFHPDRKQKQREAIRAEHWSWPRMIVEQALYGMVAFGIAIWLRAEARRD